MIVKYIAGTWPNLELLQNVLIIFEIPEKLSWMMKKWNDTLAGAL